MWQENLYEPFEILIRERDVFPVDVHRHSFFELVHIVSGNGSLSAFGKTVAYKAGDLFLIRVLRFNKSCYIIEATETITLHMADRTPAHQSSD